jgi:thiamine-phosphate pyrophosphorylase
MKCCSESLLLYAVTDRSWLNGKTLEDQVEKAIQGGATMIQLREKNLDDASFSASAFKIKKMTDRYNVPLIINDNVYVAINVNADGIHVGQTDISVKEVRASLGSDKIIGASIQTLLQAKQALKDGADYLGVGSVFPTTTKLDADSVSINVLKTICENVSIPVVAIGGIGENNIIKLKGTGISGVAVVSALFAGQSEEQDIQKKAVHLKELVLEVVKK